MKQIKVTFIADVEDDLFEGEGQLNWYKPLETFTPYRIYNPSYRILTNETHGKTPPSGNSE